MNNTVTNEDLRNDVTRAQENVAQALTLQSEAVDKKIWAVTKRLNVTVTFPVHHKYGIPSYFDFVSTIW